MMQKPNSSFQLFEVQVILRSGLRPVWLAMLCLHLQEVRKSPMKSYMWEANVEMTDHSQKYPATKDF